MLLPEWRTGGRRPWKMPEIARLREPAESGMSAPAIWRSGKLPGRSQMGKRGLWGNGRPRFDGARCNINVPMTGMLRGRLRQRAAASGLSVSELVRRFCAVGLQGAS